MDCHKTSYLLKGVVILRADCHFSRNDNNYTLYNYSTLIDQIFLENFQGRIWYIWIVGYVDVDVDM